MTLERRPVTRDHLDRLMALAVRPDQQGQVAPNVRTLAQAAYEPCAHVWGLWQGESPVGLMAMVDPRGYPHFLDGDDREAAYLWRLMIDAGHQGRGYGRAAILMALDVARDWMCPRLSLGVSDDKPMSQGFYERMGFRLTGRVVDGDRMMARDVSRRRPGFSPASAGVPG